MKFIGFEREDEAVAWAKRIIGIEAPHGFCRALSAVDSDGDFALVIVMSNFTRYNIDMHTAAVDGGSWATPKATIRMFNAAFGYVFDQLRALRVTGLVKASNQQARRFDEHLGFRLEGVMRKAFAGEDLCIYGFLAEDFATHPWRRSK